MEQFDLEKFMSLFRAINKYDLDNQLHFEITSPGNIIYRMNILDKHLSSPQTAHGAVVAGFMDCVLGLSALSLAVTQGLLTSTVEFKINFLRPVHLGEDIIGSGQVVHRGKSLLISSGEIKNSAGEMVALGQGTFNAYPFSKKDYLNEFTRHF
jgi:uncharacterized protein (TIGR00369 family)